MRARMLSRTSAMGSVMRHVMAGAGEHLRNAMAHQAAAEDRDALRVIAHPAV